MARNDARFWRELAVQVGEMSEPEVKLLKSEGYPRDYADMDEYEQEGLIEVVSGLIESIRASGFTSGPITVREPHDASGRADMRWSLVRDLAEAGGVDAPAPLSFEGAHPFVLLDAPVGTHDRVTISFDSRLSQQSLIHQVRRFWPTMRARGWVNPSRTLGERKVALVRFVCLESGIDTSWPERFRRWNEQHPGEWAYKSLAAFISAFRRGEESLTGQKYGLAWLYDPDVRRVWELPLSELKRRYDSTEYGRAEKDALAKAHNLRQPPHRYRSEDEFHAWLNAWRDKEQGTTEGGGTDGGS